MRVSLRNVVPRVADRIWREGQTGGQGGPFKAVPEGEAFFQQIQDLKPTNDMQRGLQARIAQVTNDLMQARFLLFSHLGSRYLFPFSQCYCSG